ncbi:MAG: YkgJ family cysteine cluster protein [Gammaproteobacteria bacterium]|nr:YkgJ family cysteine cluster protein [Gammaproteobacteria bacterium]
MSSTPTPLSDNNPCIICGACCVSFRVSFYWGETTTVQVGGVPDELTEKINNHRVAMRGTNQKNPRCIALDGEISQLVSCSIYDNRPSPCREFVAGEPRCIEARLKHGVLDFIPASCA